MRRGDWKYTILVMIAFSCNARAETAKETIAEFDSLMNTLGTPKIEGMNIIAGKNVPVMYFGYVQVNGHYDIVDTIKRRKGATATVFVKTGEEFIRVTTNVLTVEGGRGIGTLLAHNEAYQALINGRNYCGDVDVLGTQYSACYDAVKDTKGNIIGATYVGYKK